MDMLSEMQSYIAAAEEDASLYEAKNFDKRMEAIDFIGFHVIEWAAALLPAAVQPDQLLLLLRRAEKVKAELEETDTRLFQRLQAAVRAAGCKGFRDLVHEYTALPAISDSYGEAAGYDNLDLFINGLSSLKAMPEQTLELEPEMVYYQKTPARVVFGLAELIRFTKDDVFFDLGAGLGQVAILVHLLTGVPARGVEFEPAFCDYARGCAAELHLPDVIFMNADAREADYSEGTVFFMFTPFRGGILQEVLGLLKKASLRRKIRIITYGPCTAQVALQSWLRPLTPETENIYQLAVFSSC